MVPIPRGAALAATLAFFRCAGSAHSQQHLPETARQHLAEASRQPWVGTWAAAPVAAPNTAADFVQDRTLREIVHVSIGGPALRLVLSNEFGTGPLTIGAVQAASSTGNGSGQPGSGIPVSFSGHPGIVIPAGALAVSDPVVLKLPALSDLAVSIFVPAQKIEILTHHKFADAANYEADGNQIAAPRLTQPHVVSDWLFLKGVDVEAPSAKSGRHAKNPPAAIVTLGASITDGAHSSRDANHRWPDVLAQRLQANKSTANLGVLNEGIGGNRLLHDGASPNALARFDRDVLAQAGVKYLIVADDALNDIGAAQNPRQPHDVVTADDLIAALAQIAVRAHMHGIKIYGATLTPYVGAGYESPAGELMRQAVNQWIRSTPGFDGVIDFDKATRDPAHPGAFLAAYDSGDHLHPNDAGYKAMGDAIDLSVFSE